MKPSAIVFLFQILVVKLVVSNNSFELVAYTVNSMADFFSSTCLYFLTSSSKNDLINQRLASSVSSDFGKSLAFYNFSSYFDALEKGDRGQCQVPLRVILQLEGNTISKDFKGFNRVYLNHPNKMRFGVWLIFAKSLEDKFVSEFFRDIYLPFDIEVIIAWIHNEMAHFKEVYQVAPSHAYKQIYFGNWSSKRGPNLPRTSFYSRRTDLEGLQLKVGYIDENVPFTMMRPTARKNYLEGYMGEIWNAVQDLINISSIYYKIDLMRGKDKNKNSWLSVMKMLQEKQIDVGLGDFVSSKARLDYLDFSYPLLISNFQVFYKNIPHHHYSHAYLLPFGKDIWLTLLIWSIVHSSCISCTTLIRKRFIKHRVKVIRAPTSYFMTFGGLCGQGLSNTPRCSPCRLLYLFTYIVSTIIIPSYSASLTRFLTTKTSGIILRNLNDLYETGFHKVLVVDGSYEFYKIQNISRNNVHMKKLFERDIKNKKLPKSYREALLLTCEEKNLGFFTITSTLTWEINKAENAHLKDECSLRKMADNAEILLIGNAYSKNSRFRGLIDYHLKNLQKTGIMKRLQDKYWSVHPNLLKKFNRPFGWESVSLQNSSALFRIIICGVTISCMIIILEQVFKRRICKTFE